jgi:hypothetical protein
LQDLNEFQYFAQVVRHGGFSAAARATGEPKAKLGKRVAQLERGLGVRLIERSSDQPAYCRVVIGRSRPRRAAEEELAWLRTGAPDITVDRLTGLLPPLEPDGLTGLLLKRW